MSVCVSARARGRAGPHHRALRRQLGSEDEVQVVHGAYTIVQRLQLVRLEREVAQLRAHARARACHGLRISRHGRAFALGIFVLLGMLRGVCWSILCAVCAFLTRTWMLISVSISDLSAPCLLS